MWSITICYLSHLIVGQHRLSCYHVPNLEVIYTAGYLISNVLCLTVNVFFGYIIIQLPFAQFRALVVSSIMHILLILSIHAIKGLKLHSSIDQRLRLLYTSTAPYKNGRAESS